MITEPDDFTPPVQRLTPTHHQAVLPLNKAAFLKAAEDLIPRLKDPSTGQNWHFDGHRGDTLYLQRPALPERSLPALTVQFDLAYSNNQVTVSVATDNALVLDLFHAFTRELAQHTGGKH